MGSINDFVERHTATETKPRRSAETAASRKPAAKKPRSKAGKKKSGVKMSKSKAHAADKA